MMRDVVIRAAIAALMLLGAASFVVDWQRVIVPPGVEETVDASLEGDPTEMKAQVEGYLINVPARDDSVVHRGDLLFLIDDRDYQARVDRAGAEVAEAGAEIDVAKAELAQQTADIIAAKARVEAAEANKVRAAQDRARQAGLLHTESFLARDWQSAVAADQGAEAAVEGSQQALASARAQIDVLAAHLDARRAELDGKRAALALAMVQLGYTRVAAPFDATVTARLARRGDYVGPGTALITLVPMRDAWAVANFREEQLTRMAPGQRARVIVDAIPGVIFGGRVDSIEATTEAEGSAFPPDRAVGSFTKIVQRVPVKIVLDARPDCASRLRPGLSAEVDVDTGGGRS